MKNELTVFVCSSGQTGKEDITIKSFLEYNKCENGIYLSTIHEKTFPLSVNKAFQECKTRYALITNDSLVFLLSIQKLFDVIQQHSATLLCDLESEMQFFVVDTVNIQTNGIRFLNKDYFVKELKDSRLDIINVKGLSKYYKIANIDDEKKYENITYDNNQIKDKDVSGRIVMYTALFGNYDKLHDIPNVPDNFDLVCFTDADIKSNIWQIRKVKSLPTKMGYDSFAKTNRYYKMHPHLFFSQYDINIYIDAGVREIDFDYFKKYYNNMETDLVLLKHPERDCIYEEAEACKYYNRDKPQIIDSQIAVYKKQGFPEHYGLSENRLMIRKTNSIPVIKLLEFWWGEVNERSQRDQLSLFYSIWKTDKQVDLEFINFTRQELDFHIKYKVHGG